MIAVEPCSPMTGDPGVWPTKGGWGTAIPTPGHPVRQPPRTVWRNTVVVCAAARGDCAGRDWFYLLQQAALADVMWNAIHFPYESR